MVNVQLRRLFSLKQLLIINYSLLILTSCSIQQKISKSAKQVINDSSLITAHVGMSIYEPATGKYWYNYQGDKYFVPASNTKIPTCYAAMKYLGDSLVGYRYSVRDSMIIILPTGDPSFLHADYNSSRAIEFMKKFKVGSLLANTIVWDKWGSGWSWNDYTEAYMAERSSFPMYGNTATFYIEDNRIIAYPQYFNKKLMPADPIIDSFEITRAIDSNDFRIKKGNYTKQVIPFNTGNLLFRLVPSVQADLLSDTLDITVTAGLASKVERNDYIKFHSQATDSLLKPMMHRSDNFFAEQSLLMVSNEMLGVMNDDKIIDTLLKTDLKNLPQKPRWADGSGLSRYNLFTPQDFIAILDQMQNEFGMERIKVVFPTGGEGTISNYYKADSNFIFAKTGTLSGVVALSGFLYTKKGKLLIFSALVNNHQASSTAVRRTVERFIQAIRNKY